MKGIPGGLTVAPSPPSSPHSRRCEECGQSVPGPRQRFCRDCSKRRFYRSHFDYNRRPFEAGLIVNRQERTSISWPLELPPPDLIYLLRIAIPYDRIYSKNSANKIGGGRFYTNREVLAARDALMLLIRSSSADHSWKIRKTYIDILVQKPHHWGDAVNVIDTICDAVKQAIGVDDRWFSLRRVEWQITKENPRIYIGIGQEEGGDQFPCRACGSILDMIRFHNSYERGKKINAICCCCRAARSKIARRHFHA